MLSSNQIFALKILCLGSARYKSRSEVEGKNFQVFMFLERIPREILRYIYPLFFCFSSFVTLSHHGTLGPAPFESTKKFFYG
jgi:hypothetical protein